MLSLIVSVVAGRASLRLIVDVEFEDYQIRV
jgi:hypothetical protein